MAQAFALACGEQARAVVVKARGCCPSFLCLALRSRSSLLKRSPAAGLDRALRALHQLAPAGTPAP